MEMRGSDRNAEIISSICLSGIQVQNLMERMSRTSDGSIALRQSSEMGARADLVLAHTIE
jgi:hypothetical protein